MHVKLISFVAMSTELQRVEGHLKTKGITSNSIRKTLMNVDLKHCVNRTVENWVVHT